MHLSQNALCLVVVLGLLHLQCVRALWPLPQSITTGPSTAFLRLDPTFAVTLSSNSSGPDLSANAPQDLLDAINRTESHIWSDKLGRLVVGRGESDLPCIRSSPALTSLVLSLSPTNNAPSINSIATEAQKAPELRNEVYNLSVPDDGSPAMLSAQTTLGLLRGLTTFEQMWYYAADSEGEETYASGVPVEIQDEPAFVSVLHLCIVPCLSAFQPHRGFMLDTARNLCVDHLLP